MDSIADMRVRSALLARTGVSAREAARQLAQMQQGMEYVRRFKGAQESIGANVDGLIDEIERTLSQFGVTARVARFIDVDAVRWRIRIVTARGEIVEELETLVGWREKLCERGWAL